jgi:cytochrome c556
MRTKFMNRAYALLAIAGFSTAPLAQTSSPATPEDVIAARQALMFAIEKLMQPIDTYTVDPDVDPATLRDAADSIAAMLLAVPHLFPPATDLYDPDAEMPATLALPAIWQDYAAFYAMAEASANAASTMAATKDPEQLRDASLSLRSTCDACHALYLRPYVSGEVTEEDLNFDFDSVFGPE